MSQSTISTNKLVGAATNSTAGGTNQQLLEVLRQIVANQQVQQTATNTGTKNVPPQSTATVSYLQGNYIVEIQPAGTAPATSTLQAAQASQGATLASNLAPVTPVYNQVRCATTPRFDIASNVQTFGGSTGSTQTTFTLTNLGGGTFYFQIRQSYDGVNWNLWKNANGGQSITSRASSVTLEAVENGQFGVFQLAGAELVAVGAGFTANGNGFTLPDYLYSSAMAAIAGPNGYTNTGNDMHSIAALAVDIEQPLPAPVLTGPADYNIVVPMLYQDGENHQWPGDANWFAFAYDPLGKNISLVEYASGNWAIFNMPGGWQMAVGSGIVESGSAFTLPPGFSATSMVSIAAPNDFTDTGYEAEGIYNCSITGATVTMEYANEGAGQIWSTHAQWFAIAWTPGIAATAVTGGKFLVFTAPSGSKIAFGSGQVASGSAFSLPTGFNSTDMLAFPTPASFTESSNHAHGIANCSITGTTCTLAYTDGDGYTWAGNVNWFAFCWTN